jgi:hypothetical protein
VQLDPARRDVLLDPAWTRLGLGRGAHETQDVLRCVWVDEIERVDAVDRLADRRRYLQVPSVPPEASIAP